MAKKPTTLVIVRENKDNGNPPLLLGETREDLERVYAEGNDHKRYPFLHVIKDEEGNRVGTEIIGETLTPYPNDEEYELIEE